MQMFCLAIPAALLDCIGFDVFQDERICVHIYDLNDSIPPPLLEVHDGKRLPRDGKTYFQSGLPELLLCTSGSRFLDLFQYFWPISQQEFRSMQEEIQVKTAKAKLISAQDVEELARYLARNDQLTEAGNETSAVILTLNDHTLRWASEIVQVCRSAKITEFVVFKDPSKPPYLCSYPARQKGFKRPPPIGSKS